MSKTEWILCGALALSLMLNAALFWDRGKTPAHLEAIEAKANQMLREVEAYKAEVDGLYTRIDQARDTIEVIENRRTINYNTYVQTIAGVMRRDSSDQFRHYKRNSAKFDSLFFAGFFFDRKPR